MCKFGSANLVPYDPEIKKIAKKLRKGKKNKTIVNMVVEGHNQNNQYKGL